MQNARVTDFIVFELLKENQHRWGGGGCKITSHPPTEAPRLGLMTQ